MRKNLGIWKILGALALLAPKFPRLKECAYAGIASDLTGAAFAWAVVGHSGTLGNAVCFHEKSLRLAISAHIRSP